MEEIKLEPGNVIQLPDDAVKEMEIKPGDSLILFKKDGLFCLDRADFKMLKEKGDQQTIDHLAFVDVIKAFEGSAKEAGFNSEQEMQDYMLEIRKEVRGY